MKLSFVNREWFLAKRTMNHASSVWSRSAALLMGILLACIGASAQVAADKMPNGIPSPLPGSVLQAAAPKLDLNVKTDANNNWNFFDRAFVTPTTLSTIGPDGVRRLTLEEAQQAAGGAGNPLVRLGQLSVEAAKQHRQGVEGLYFPNVSTTLLNFHLNKQTGQVLSLPRLGIATPVNIFHKDSTTFNATVAQPLTPLLSIRQLVKIARADENIAKAKAGMPVAETAMKVEKVFFDLLVAQRELTSTAAEARMVQSKWVTASNSRPVISAEQERDMLNAEKSVLLSTSKVNELSASLNQMIGLPEGTKLQLIAPEPFAENISLTEATQRTAANPEVIEAEQTAVKAHAGLTLSKLQYVPTVAVLAGYAHQNLVANSLLPRDFGYIGIMATFTVFDGFKREHGVKEVQAQAEMADMGVQLTKAKVAAAVKTSYLELDRARQLYQLARRLVSTTQMVEASYKPQDTQVESARAKVEADMFRAELEYRQAYARLKALLGAQ